MWSLNLLRERIWPYKGLTDGRGLLGSILSLFSPLLHSVHLAGFSVFHVVFPSLPSSKVPSQAAAGQSKLKSVPPSVPNYFCFLFQISLFTLISQAQFCLVSLFSILAFRYLWYLCSCSCPTEPDPLPSSWLLNICKPFFLSVPSFLQTLYLSPSAHQALPPGCYSFLLMRSSFKWSVVYTCSLFPMTPALMSLAKFPYALFIASILFSFPNTCTLFFSFTVRAYWRGGFLYAHLNLACPAAP